MSLLIYQCCSGCTSKIVVDTDTSSRRMRCTGPPSYTGCCARMACLRMLVPSAIFQSLNIKSTHICHMYNIAYTVNKEKISSHNSCLPSKIQNIEECLRIFEAFDMHCSLLYDMMNPCLQLQWDVLSPFLQYELAFHSSHSLSSRHKLPNTVSNATAVNQF